MAAIISQQRPNNVLPYLLVVKYVLPYVLAIHALGAFLGMGSMWINSLPLA